MFFQVKSGIEILIECSVPTLKGGSVNEITVKKGLRLHEIVMENKLPSISLLQSGGADLTQQARVFHSGGGSFRNLAKRAQAGLPTICCVFGSCTAGGAYTPGMSLYTVMVKGNAKVFLGGPPLVKMATGEIVDSETLGGAKMHSSISGVSDYFAKNEYEALSMTRDIVKSLNWIKSNTEENNLEIEEPLYDSDQILGVVKANIRQPYDSRELICRIVDGSRFLEFKPMYGKTIVCCNAKIFGTTVGIIANNGVLFSESSQKSTQFIRLCNNNNTPILFLQNITGFMVGKKYEQGGIIKHGSKLINAISNSTVPAITIAIGASYGAGNYAMCGRPYNPRFLFSYPNSSCSVMGPEQLAGVLDIVARDSAKKAGIKLNEKMLSKRKELFIGKVRQQSDVYYTSSRMIDDGIIDPRDTRVILGITLSVIKNNIIKGSNFGGVSRL